LSKVASAAEYSFLYDPEALSIGTSNEHCIEADEESYDVEIVDSNEE
jgi:hypothetical protein